MLTDIELRYSVNQVNIEQYLYSKLTACGYSICESLELSEYYLSLIRTTSFTKTGAYGVSMRADTKTGKVTLKANGFQLRNKKDIIIEIKELVYRKSWWTLFLSYALTRKA